MLKAEELKILEQIEKLIDHAGADSYIRMTFAGVPEVCKRNIEDDFADCPVKDLESERRNNDELGKMIMRLEHENNALSATITAKDAEIEKLGHLLDSKTAECERIKEERDCMSDCVEGNAEILADAESEIRKLKAEIVRMRMERMTEAEIAELYEKAEGVRK